MHTSLSLRFRGGLLALGVLAAAAAAPLAAQDEPASAPPARPDLERELRLYDIPFLQGDPAPMSLRDVVLTTIAYNLDLRLSGIDRDIAASRVFAEYGFYDPLFQAEVVYSDTERQVAPGSSLAAEQRRVSTGAGVTQRTGIGTAVFVEANEVRTRDRSGAAGFGAPGAAGSFGGVSTFSAGDWAYDHSVSFGVRQPLLRGFGLAANNLQLRVAKRELEQANAAFRLELQTRVAAVMNAYWELVFALQQLDVDQTSLDAALELERVQEARVRVGRSPRLELIQAQAQVAQREFLLTLSQERVVNAQDALLALMNWNREAGGIEWSRPILPTDRPTTIEDLALVDRDLIEFAEFFRPDYESALIAAEIAGLRRDVARRDMLPQLDAFAQYTTTGLETSRSDAASTLFGDYEGWSTGLAFSYPLFNRRARGLYQQAVDRVEQSALRIDGTELRITREVRAATRRLRTTLAQVEAARRGVESERERVEAERLRLDVGDRTIFNVLDALDDLATAEGNLVRALADFQIALVQLGQATGTILWAQGIEVEDQDGPDLFSLRFSPAPEPRISGGFVPAWEELVRGTPNIRAGGGANPLPGAARRDAAAPMASDIAPKPQ